MANWIYNKNEDNACRYILGVDGKNILICCGINPSTAKPNNLDNTVMRVENFSKDNGYIMINIYPQISTNPKNINLDLDEFNHNEMLKS